MQKKEGYCWEAVYDEEKELYTAGFFSALSGSCTLYEINKSIYDSLQDGMDNSATSLFCAGRKLYMHVNDLCGPPYTIVFDKEYNTMCPWASVPAPNEEETWPDDMTDSVIEVLASEKENRKHRRKCKKDKETEE